MFGINFLNKITPQFLPQTVKLPIVPIRVTSREIYYLGSEVERLYEALTKSK